MLLLLAGTEVAERAGAGLATEGEGGGEDREPGAPPVLLLLLPLLPLVLLVAVVLPPLLHCVW